MMEEIIDAAKKYRAAGIIVHPLSSPKDHKPSPGKRPLLSRWQKLDTNPSDEELDNYFVKKDYNIGAVCGKASDLMVIDVDWYIKGMWDDILKGVDTSDWVKQHRTAGRWHWLFRFNPAFELKHAKALGMDLLGESGNVVMAPSIHESGSVYKMDGDITKRPHIPKNVISSLTKWLNTYQELRIALNKIRPVFKEFLEAVFVKDDLGKDADGNKIANPMYHDLSVFRNMDGRQRMLHICAELMASGADHKQMMLFCMMAFGNEFDRETSAYQLKKIDPNATAKIASIKADPLLSQFYKTGRSDIIEDEYRNYYSIDVGANGKATIKLNLAGIAAGITKKLLVISYAEQLYIYREGCYVEGLVAIKSEVQNIAKTVGYTGPLSRITSEVIHYLMYEAPYSEYPFNHVDNMIPVNNGVVMFDFDTGDVKLVSHDPKYMFNYKLNADFDPESMSDDIHEQMITKYVKTEHVAILYQIPAQALLQMVSDPYKKAYLVQGDPNAGKSTYIELLERVFGMDIICGESLQSLSDNRFAKASLEGKTLNIFDDLSDIPMSETGTFKTLTGKRWHSIEKKGKQAYMAPLGALHVFTCNAPPSFDKKVKNDTAFWDRWEYVFFPYFFEKDPGFTVRMFTPENLSGFLYRVIKNMIDIKRNGLKVRSSAGEVREMWSYNSDPVYQFFQEGIDFERKAVNVSKEDLLDSIIRWALANDVDTGKIPSTTTGLTQSIDKYEVYARRPVDENGIRVHTYELPGAWKHNFAFAAPVVRLKTEQVKL
ncbi:MAG: bifunctional DNA primase/polymerase [Methanolobus sp.]|nr:bifunctional DNA primase/polymerase [Methanolobus sp.]